MADTPNLELDLIAEGEGGRITHNENMRKLDILVSNIILAIQNTPVGAPSEGDAYIVGAAPTGDYIGHEDDIAVYWDSDWVFYTPEIGWKAILTASWEYVGLIYRDTAGGYDSTKWWRGVHCASIADAITGLTDNSGGSSGGDTVAVVTDIGSAADAIATLSAKVNAIIQGQKDSTMMST